MGAIEIPNEVHAAGVALFGDLANPTVGELVAGQGFAGVENEGALGPQWYRWVMDSPIDPSRAVVRSASNALGTSLVAIVGEPPTPWDLLLSAGVSLEPTDVLVQQQPSTLVGFRGTMWCAVFEVPQ